MSSRTKFRRKWSFTGGQVKNSVIVLEAVLTSAAVLSVLFLLFDYRVQPAKREYDSKISVNYVELKSGSADNHTLEMLDPSLTLSLVNSSGFGAQLPLKNEHYQMSRPVPEMGTEKSDVGSFVKFSAADKVSGQHYLAGIRSQSEQMRVRELNEAVIIGDNGEVAARIPLLPGEILSESGSGMVRIVRFGTICRSELISSCGLASLDRRAAEFLTAMANSGGIYVISVPARQATPEEGKKL